MIKIPRKELITLFDQLHMCVSAGLSITAAIEIVCQSAPRKYKKTWEGIGSAIQGGQRISRAFSDHIRLPRSTVGLIVSGEMSGRLSESFHLSKEILERQDEVLKKILSALTYPIIIGLATVGLTIGLVNGILPQIIPLLKSLKVDLPVLTKIVIYCSDYMMKYGFVTAFAIFAYVFALIVLYRRSKKFKELIHTLLLHTPIMGKITRTYTYGLFFQSFGAMLSSGILSMDALEKSVESVSLIPLQKKIGRAVPILRNGADLSVLSKDMPAYVGGLMKAGQSSAKFATAIGHIAEILDKELDLSLKRLTALIEPMMMLGMGGIVGSVALSIMMPIYDISKNLQK